VSRFDIASQKLWLVDATPAVRLTDPVGSILILGGTYRRMGFAGPHDMNGIARSAAIPSDLIERRKIPVSVVMALRTLICGCAPESERVASRLRSGTVPAAYNG
jgi:hypothetical protein